MRYFKLSDDVNVPDRWHVGEVTLPDGEEPDFISGRPCSHEGRLAAPVTHAGIPLAFSLTSFAVPIATRRLAEAIRTVTGADVECLPVEVDGQGGMVVLNAVRVVRCVDETRSEFLKWTSKDHRADLAGQYRQVTRLVLEPSTVLRLATWCHDW